MNAPGEHAQYEKHSDLVGSHALGTTLVRSNNVSLVSTLCNPSKPKKTKSNGTRPFSLPRELPVWSRSTGGEDWAQQAVEAGVSVDEDVVMVDDESTFLPDQGTSVPSVQPLAPRPPPQVDAPPSVRTFAPPTQRFGALPQARVPNPSLNSPSGEFVPSLAGQRHRLDQISGHEEAETLSLDSPVRTSKRTRLNPSPPPPPKKWAEHDYLAILNGGQV